MRTHPANPVYQKIPILFLSILIACSQCNWHNTMDADDTTAATTLSQRSMTFNAERALQLVNNQLEFGPRFSGTEGHQNMIDLISGHLKQFASEVTTVPFTHLYNGKHHAFTNIIADFLPPGADKSSPKLLLMAHWDTRPFADQDSQHPNTPIPGANDGASGVAILLHLAEIISALPLKKPVQIAFFDGEDFGKTKDDMFLGSTHFSKTINPKDYRYGILLDMVGDKDLQIYQEGYSIKYAPQLVKDIWSLAKQLGLDAFKPISKYHILDDHIPLNEAGVPSIDLIDFDYPSWHTTEDTLDKIGLESLKSVGTLILEWLIKETT